MKTLTTIALSISVLSGACAHSEATPRDPAGRGVVACEAVGVQAVTETDWTASFRVANDTREPFSFVGFGKDSPMYQVEVQEGGEWQNYPMGWCGTGSSTHAIAPGKSEVVNVMLPADGRSYRFRFGDPAVVTPPVSAQAK